MPRVSVIMPSLNVAKYIGDCLDSVIHQTLYDIEIICVDAGSMDGTRQILEEYKQKDSRITIIDATIRSYGYQVNIGITAATGEYIAIVETDDTIDRNMYKELFEIAQKDNLDLIKGDYWILTGNKGDHICEKKNILPPEKRDLYGKTLIHDWENNFSGRIYTWAGIYKREFLIKNGIRHNETPGAAYQDNGFYFQTMIYASRTKYINKAYYYLRRDNDDSSYFATDIIDALRNEFDYINDRIDESVLDNKKELFEFCSFFRFKSYIGQERRILDKDFNEYFKLIKEDMWDACLNGEIDLSLYNDREYMYLMYVLSQKKAVRFSSGQFISIAENYVKANRNEILYIWADKQINEIFALIELFGFNKKTKCITETAGIDNKKGKTVLVLGDKYVNNRINDLRSIGIRSIVTIWI